jgi:hypothetical protein
MSTRNGSSDPTLPTALSVHAATTIAGDAVTARLDSSVAARARNFSEALRQAKPLARLDDPALAHTIALVRDGTARLTGLRDETAVALATSGRDPLSFAQGAHPHGTCAEIVVARAFRDHHAGRSSGLVNAPAPPPNVVDVRLSPDTASARDIVFGVETPDGLRLFRPGGQAKLGAPAYVTQGLLRMASRPGYGKTAYVDASLLNADGTPRVAPDAFTEYQAEQLRAAGIRFRGVRNLDAQARALVEDLKAYARDGLDPRARETLLALREEIALAYEPGAIGIRAASSAARSAATAAVCSLLVQLTSGGEVNLKSLAMSAVQGGAAAAGAVAADAAVFHAAVRAGLSVETARVVARKTVSGALCIVAIGLDVASELGAVQRGERTPADAAAGVATSATLNALALAVGAFGWPALPILLAAQLGGRWTLTRWREGGRLLDEQFDADAAELQVLHESMSRVGQQATRAAETSAGIDQFYAQIMGGSVPPANMSRQ